MRRRTFLTALATAAGSSAAGIRLTGRTEASSGEISELAFYSTSSLVNANYGPLTDEYYVPVWAEDTAANSDEDGNDDAYLYADDESIPLVAVDWNVVGFGSMLVNDGDASWQYGNEEFVLNVWDDALGGSGTVLWDEGHGQYYDLASFSEFESYAEDNGYTVESTSSLASDLADADAAVVTSPSEAFTSEELGALGDFVDEGGWLFLHDQSDYGDYDETANLNDIPGYLDLAFRFNDDQVADEYRNASGAYEPVTDVFDDDFDYFGDREGLGLDPEETYAVTVEDVIDGDTVKVTFDDGTTENIRILGTDTPETSSNSQYERPQEWEGISDEEYLQARADEATQFGKDELDVGSTVDLVFDDNEPVRDVYDRILGYLYYDATGDGSRDANYNYRLVEEGHARVYDSSFAKHAEFIDAERAARADGVQVWEESDPDGSPEIRDNPVDDLFFPQTASVRTSTGGIDDSRVPVYAESSATQELDGGHDYGDGELPLVGVDEDANVAVVGAPLVDESYEEAEGYDTDTSSYGNYPFFTNLVDYLSEVEGDVLVDGGHGQFGADYGVAAEDAAYYMRYLEGQDIGLEGINELTADRLSRGRALVVTTPPESFTASEVDAVQSFVDDGGAVVLVGSGATPPEARENANDLAAELGTDLRVNADRVVDDSNSVGTSADVPETTAFDDSFPLFDAYTPGTANDYDVSITDIQEDGEDSLDEYVDIRNDGDADLEMTGWTLEDEADYTYEFPDGFTLGAGETVRVHTGDGEDTDTDLYWGMGIPVWNNDGDTAYLYDDAGNLADELTYPTESDACGDVVCVSEVSPEGDTLNEEWVEFENGSSSDQEMTGWTVEDEADYTYEFPDGFTLDAGATVRLHTGSGTDSDTDLYWGSGNYVWNDGGDTVFVYDDSGSLHVERSY
ncbi:lamin tail domain-containing protein [Halorussus salilacus]|uniref:lamin tail domain-containing protein n=1 Tax=Halorussus salilacus TaxID=2953750 RepID=UPI00209EBE82|nr:DUF4350 domain-containing protein [Halorussus salilacus]USZ67543.1 lamin tail domain-containing protein [Halorussus salilacus]